MKRLSFCFAVAALQVSSVFGAAPKAAELKAPEPKAAAKSATVSATVTVTTTVKAAPKVAVGTQAPEFKIKDSEGREIDLAALTAKGPVLVRLTCGCSGCDKELAYFQELHKSYKDQGLVSLAIFKEPDTKVKNYVKEKKLDMMYAVDSKGASWDVFQTKTMPTNFLIAKGGKIINIAAGCDPSGLLATKVSEKVATLVDGEKVNIKAKVDAEKAAAAPVKK
jgi:peroxiredoxin